MNKLLNGLDAPVGSSQGMGGMASPLPAQVSSDCRADAQRCGKPRTTCAGRVTTRPSNPRAFPAANDATISIDPDHRLGRWLCNARRRRLAGFRSRVFRQSLDPAHGPPASAASSTTLLCPNNTPISIRSSAHVRDVAVRRQGHRPSDALGAGSARRHTSSTLWKPGRAYAPVFDSAYKDKICLLDWGDWTTHDACTYAGVDPYEGLDEAALGEVRKVASRRLQEHPRHRRRPGHRPRRACLDGSFVR